MIQQPVYVQYGAGLCGPAGWINFDVSPTLRLQRIPLVGRAFRSVGPVFPATVRYGDIVSGLPFAENTCDAMYCSHVLEHLALDDFRRALRNTFKYLKPGARFRFVLPDLEYLIGLYVNDSSVDAAMKFMHSTRLGHKSSPKNSIGRLRAAFGNSSHLWMWDYRSLSKELNDAGFTAIRRAEIGDSGDERFDVVENPGRWDNCLGVDCQKPLQ